jgi:hypothetical protein
MMKTYNAALDLKGGFFRFIARHLIRVIALASLLMFPTSGYWTVQAQDNTEIILELENKVMQSFDHQSWLSQISTDAVMMYYLWPGIDGLLNLYEATGNREYVGYAVEYCQRYQSLGEDVDNDGYLDWYSSWIDGYSHHHVEWRAGDGVARTVAQVLTDPNLSDYVDEAMGLRSFLEKHIWEKWTTGYSHSGNTTTVTHFIGRVGLIAISLYQATGDNVYLSYINTKGSQLKDALHLNAQDAYTWEVYTDKGGAVDVSHGGDTVNFMVEAHRLGLVFDATDIQRLINTVKKNLWNGSISDPEFRENVDGSGDYGGVGNNQGGWIKLAQYDPELQEIYYNWLQGQSASSHVGVHIHGNLARSLYLYQPQLSGDINQDGVIDQMDVQLCVDVILGSNVDPDVEERADVDSNDLVNILDVQKIVILAIE